MEIVTSTESHTERALDSFLYAVRSEKSKQQYLVRLKYFFNYLKLQGDLPHQAATFIQNATSDKQWAYDSIISWINQNKNKQLSVCTPTNYYNPVKLLCIMNDVELNWRKISRGLPSAKVTANDRSPLIEEIRKVIEYPDKRIRPIVYTMCSSGIRIGAWDFLKWKHITPPLYRPKCPTNSSKNHSLCR